MRTRPELTLMPTSRPALSIGADVLVAMACVALIPGATPFLPLVPLFVLLPLAADRIRQTIPPRTALQFVPDPKAPDWRQLAQVIASLCRRVIEDGEPRLLWLAPVCRPDGSPRNYAVDYQPGRQMLTIRACGETRTREQRLDGVLRPRIPLPLTVGAEPVTLRMDRSGPAAARQIRLSQLPADRIARSPWPGIVLPLLLAPFDWRLGCVAAAALLTPLLARAMRTPFRLDFFPLRQAVAAIPQPALPARFNLLRLWFAGLVIYCQIAPDTLWVSILRDPLALLFWGLMAPLAIHAGLRQARDQRQRRTVRPS